MRRLILALVLLSGCAPNPVVPPAATGHRDRSVPISSTTRGTPQDIAGQWIVSRALTQDALVRPGDQVLIEPVDGTWVWTIGKDTVRWKFAQRVTLPGRYLSAVADQPQHELWVLWVDDDFRTAVIGTPDGTVGWIMDRPGRASGDRTRAAREILDFNGYATPDFTGAEG